MRMYRITLFGGFEVVDNTGQRIQFRTRRGKLLIAYLASFPGVHSRDKLASLLWPDLPRARAHLCLRVELSALRHSLEAGGIMQHPLLKVTRDSVSLNTDQVFVDVLEFEWLFTQASQLDDQACISLLEQACDLYRGDYLEGYEAPWISMKRETYRLQFADLINRLYGIYINNGEYDRGMQLLNRELIKLPTKMINGLFKFYDIMKNAIDSHHFVQAKSSIRYAARRTPSGISVFAALHGASSAGTSLSAVQCENLGGVLIHRSEKMVIAVFDNPYRAAEWVSTEVERSKNLAGALTMDLWLPEARSQIVSKIQQLVISLNSGWIVCTEPVAYWLQRDSRWFLQELRFFLCGDLSERLFTLNSRHDLSIPPFRKDSSPILRERCLSSPYKKLWGREQEIEILHRWYRSAGREPSSRLLTIVGIGGIGKTHLASEFAYQIGCQSNNEVVFVSLEKVQTAAELEHAVLSALNEEFPRLRVHLEHVLNTRPMLLILDRAEHLQPLLAEQLLEWLERAPKLRVLVTSRIALDIPEERLLPLEPLPVPSTEIDDLDELQGYASVRLLLDEVRRARPHFRLTLNNAAQIAALCRFAGGIPLALILWAKRLIVYTPHQLLAELQGYSVKQTEPLDMAIGWTFYRLPVNLQCIICKLSILNDKWTLDLAREISGESLIGEYLNQLLLIGLLVVEDEKDFYWFSIPMPVREFARKLLSPEEREALGRNYALYYAHWVRQLMSSHMAWDVENLRQLRYHQNHLLASIDWLIRTGEFDMAAEMLILLAPFFETIGLFETPIRWGEQLASQPVSTERQICLLNILARFYHRIGNGWLAEQMYDRAYHLAMHSGHRAEAAKALTGLAGVHLDRLRVYQAEQLCRTVLHEYQNDASPIIRAEALLRLGYAVRAQMRTDEACQYLEHAVELYRQHGEKRYQAIALNALGFLNINRRKLQAAESLIQESLHLLREIQDHSLLPYALLRWGDLHRERGMYAEAASIYQDALEISRKVHLVGGQRAALKRLGELYYFRHKYRQARRAFKEACALSDYQRAETEPPPIEKAWYALLNRSLDEAESILMQRLRWMRENRIFSDVYYVLDLLALVFEKRKLISYSITIFEFSMAIRRKYNFYQNIKYIRMKISKLKQIKQIIDIPLQNKSKLNIIEETRYIIKDLI